MAVGSFGIQPSEYWNMSPDEIGLLMEANAIPEMYGSMTVDDVEELMQMRKTGDFL